MTVSLCLELTEVNFRRKDTKQEGRKIKQVLCVKDQKERSCHGNV